MKKRHDSDATVNEILDVAQALFIEKGYEKTTIQDIVNHLDGLSRGAIYHHFASKEIIVDEVIKRLVPSDQLITGISQREELNGLEKIQGLLIESMFDAELGESLLQLSSLLANPKLFILYIRHSNQVLAPAVAKFIAAGNQDGSLKVEYGDQVAEIVVFILKTWYMAALFPNTTENFWDKIYASQGILRAIGLDILSDQIVEKIKAEITARGVSDERKK